MVNPVCYPSREKLFVFRLGKQIPIILCVLHAFANHKSLCLSIHPFNHRSFTEISNTFWTVTNHRLSFPSIDTQKMEDPFCFRIQKKIFFILENLLSHKSSGGKGWKVKLILIQLLLLLLCRCYCCSWELNSRAASPNKVYSSIHFN